MRILRLYEAGISLRSTRILKIGDPLAGVSHSEHAALNAGLVRLSNRRGVNYTETFHRLISSAVLQTNRLRAGPDAPSTTTIGASAMRDIVDMKCETLRAHINRRRGSNQLQLRSADGEDWLLDYDPPATFACELTDDWRAWLTARLDHSTPKGPTVIEDRPDRLEQVYFGPLARLCALSTNRRPRLDIIGCTGNHSMLTIAFGAKSLTRAGALHLRGFDCRLLLGQAATGVGLLEQFGALLAERDCTLTIRRLTEVPANVGHAIGMADCYSVVRLMFNPRSGAARASGPQRYFSSEDPTSESHAWFRGWFSHLWQRADPVVRLPYRPATSERSSDKADLSSDPSRRRSDVLRVTSSSTVNSPINVEPSR